MWPTTTRNRGKSGTPGRGNEIWEGLRPLSFFSFAAPPHPRPGVAPAPTPYLRAVRAARPGRMARPAVPARGYRPSACPLRRPYGRPRDQKECGGENCPACPGRPPPGSGPRWLVVVGAWWCGAGPAVGRRRSAPVSFRRRPKRGGRSPPARLKAVLGAGPGGSAGRPPCGLAVPPVAAVWSLGAFLPPRVGRAALGLPWPVPARGAVIGWPGPPSAPAAGMGAAPFPGPALWSSLAWSRAAAVPARASPVAPGNGGRRQCVARRAGVWIPPPAGGGERPGA